MFSNNSKNTGTEVKKIPQIWNPCKLFDAAAKFNLFCTKRLFYYSVGHCISNPYAETEHF
jgi:hypothetical protein